MERALGGVALAVTTALLTSLVAPELLERSRQQAASIQKEKEAADRLTNAQTEIVEKLNATLWHYRTAAHFLVFDFLTGERRLDLLAKRISTYDAAAETTIREVHTQSFRARMYFRDPLMFQELSRRYARIMELDGRIAVQLRLQNYSTLQVRPEWNVTWDRLDKDLSQDIETIGVMLNELFLRIGEPGPVQNNTTDDGTSSRIRLVW